MRVIAPDVGGGFGVKTGPYREEVLLAWLARAARPPRQVGVDAPRGPGDDQPGARLRLRGRAGAGRGRAHHRPPRARSPSPLGASAHVRGAGLAVESRALPARRLRGPELRHHGQGRAHHHRAGLRLSRGGAAGGVLRHRAADGHGGARARARSRGDPAAQLDPRRRFPFTTITGQVYDSGDYPQALDRALPAADYAGLRRPGRAAREGRDRRAWGSRLRRALRARLGERRLRWSAPARHRDHRLERARPGARDHLRAGRGRHLGVTPDDVTVLHGDTRSGPEGFGTFGSRSVALGGGALVRASVEVRDKGRRIAARLLEAGPRTSWSCAAASTWPACRASA